MQQRSSNATRVKVWTTVPVGVRSAAEKVAGANLSKRSKARRHPNDDGPHRVTTVLGSWLVDVVELRAARSDADALAIVERLRGKPLVLPAVEVAS